MIIIVATNNDKGNDNSNDNNDKFASSRTNSNNINCDHVTKYARTYQDGNTVAVTVLGRNNITFIKWSRIRSAH